MIHDLESLPSAWGSNSTYYFMKDYIKFEQLNSEQALLESTLSKEEKLENATLSTKTDVEFNPDDLYKFVSWDEFAYWDGFVKLKNIRYTF